MRKLLLLGVAALLLACSVFASTASAQEVGDITVDTVTLGPGGSVIVTGTVECGEAGTTIFGSIDVRQRTAGNTFNTATANFRIQCQAPGPTSFTTDAAFGDRPFHTGPASVSGGITVCDINFNCNENRFAQAVRIGR